MRKNNNVPKRLAQKIENLMKNYLAVHQENLSKVNEIQSLKLQLENQIKST
jgi:hypothetical protein